MNRMNRTAAANWQLLLLLALPSFSLLAVANTGASPVRQNLTLSVTLSFALVDFTLTDTVG